MSFKVCSRRFVVGLAFAGQVLGSLVLAPGARASELAPVVEDVYTATLGGEIKKLVGQGYEETSLHGDMITQSCGFAGCSYSMLIVHTFSTLGANTQSTSILAKVDVDPLGAVVAVRRTGLVPVIELELMPE